MAKKSSDREMRTLTGDEIAVVAGGVINLAASFGTNVVARPDGGTCTDPWPLPPKGPLTPRLPFPWLR
jgi:uncharacterized circularly permuted ATP-grasp superfamily protein